MLKMTNIEYYYNKSVDKFALSYQAKVRINDSSDLGYQR